MTALEQLDRIRLHNYVGSNAAALLRHDHDELKRTLEEEQEEIEKKAQSVEDLTSLHKEMKDTWLHDLNNDMGVLFDEWEELLKQL